jgi:hypothetical protein
MWHVWHAAGSLMPESRRAIQEAGAFIRAQVNRQPSPPAEAEVISA